MAMHATQKQRNIQGSIEKYLSTTLATADSVSVQWPTVPFNADQLESWASLNFLTTTPRESFRMANSAGDGATDNLVLLQVSCFARTSKPSTGAQATRYLLETLVDKVLGRLAFRQYIDIYDYASSSTTTTSVGTLQVIAVDVARLDTASVVTGEQGVRSEQGIAAAAVTVTLQWTAIHGRS